jgi:L-malate glycosyltransferase
MKITFFTENSYAGGLDAVIISLVNNWPHNEDQLTIICNQSHPGLEQVKKRTNGNCRILAHDIPMQWEILSRLNRLPLGNFVWKLFSIVLRYPFFLFYMKKIEKILRLENPDRLMVVNGGYPAGDSCRAAAAIWPATAPNKPLCIFNFHNMVVPPRWWERWTENFIDKRVANGTKLFVSVSKACAKSMENRPAIFETRKITHILNGISDFAPVDEQEVLAIRSNLFIPESAPVCLMMGTYEQRKGHEFLFNAFKLILEKVSNAHLIICGFGYDEDIDRVRRLIENMGLEKQIHMLDFRNDGVALIEAADVLLVSSQAFESFGLTIVEAMAQATPVVATDVGGIPEVIGDNLGGFCVRFDDAVEYAKRVITLLEDKELNKLTGRHGRQRFLDNFTAKRMAEEYAVITRRN